MRATGLESSIHYTYRREVYASGQEVFMTQRVARPMKFAAFISIIISVAVMLAACQEPYESASVTKDRVN